MKAKNPADLTKTELVKIALYARDFLFLTVDSAEYTLDKEVSGADYIEHMTGILATYGLVPKDSRGWVFVNETDGEIGFAEAREYECADHAIQGFTQNVRRGLSVVFRDTNGELHPCSDESIPADFV